jgi:hypothetical protein
MRGATAVLVALVALALPASAAARGCPGSAEPSAFASAATLRKLNEVQWRFGVRATGNENHRRYIDWLERRMKAVPGVRMRSVRFEISRWDHRSTSLQLGEERLAVAGPIPYTKSTGTGGASAPLVYLPAGQPITAANAAGRIVVRDRGEGSPKEDPDLEAAGAAGAAGLLFVADLPRRQIRGFYRPYRGVHWQVPGAYLGADEGQRIKAALAAGAPVPATLTVRATTTPASTRMLRATLPGRGKRRFVVQSHTDGVNAIWDNGPIVMLAMARYLAELPVRCRPTVEFAFTTAHLYQSKASSKWLAERLDREYDSGRVAAVMAVEHFGAFHYDSVARSNGPGNVLRRSSRHEPLVVAVTDSERLRAAVRQAVSPIAPAVVVEGLDASDPNRVPVHCSFGGEGGPYNQRLVPTVGAISGPAVLFAPEFGMEAVDFRFMRRQSLAFTDLLLDMSRMSQAAIAGEIPDLRRRRSAGAPGCGEAPGAASARTALCPIPAGPAVRP